MNFLLLAKLLVALALPIANDINWQLIDTAKNGNEIIGKDLLQNSAINITTSEKYFYGQTALILAAEKIHPSLNIIVSCEWNECNNFNFWYCGSKAI